jgi:hypothetical protein
LVKKYGTGVAPTQHIGRSRYDVEIRYRPSVGRNKKSGSSLNRIPLLIARYDLNDRWLRLSNDLRDGIGETRVQGEHQAKKYEVRLKSL